MASMSRAIRRRRMQVLSMGGRVGGAGTFEADVVYALPRRAPRPRGYLYAGGRLDDTLAQQRLNWRPGWAVTRRWPA
jgi:hypothetical protein